MSFISWQFPFFLVGFVLLYWRLPHRLRLWLLLLGSYVFYAFWDVRFLALVFTTTVVDYLCALGIAGERRQSGGGGLLLVMLPAGWLLGVFWFVPGSDITPAILATALAASLIFLGIYLMIQLLPTQQRSRGFLFLSLIFCLAILGYFKYCNFFINSAASALGFLGLKADWPTLNIILPVGISFYTFQSLGYVIDVYRGQGQVCRDLLTFAVFDAFFPQMVAGPIERGRQLIPQLERDLKFDPLNLHDGLVLILVGVFKKIFVADNCALLANYVFNPGTALNAYWAILGGLAFAFQIYGDFSGYTDIARGTAKMLGVELVHNFHFPYLARNPSDFWSRWHMSLSSWFRDYVYIPLGGNRGTSRETVRNLMLTMLLAGLWHGASWVFVVWGAYHGLLLVLYRFGPLRWLNRKHDEYGRLSWLALLVMFTFTLVGWAIFRSPTLGHFWIWLTALGHWGPVALPWQSSWWWLCLHVIPLILLQILTLTSADEARLLHLPWVVRGTVYTVLILLVISSTAQDQEFIYFQF
jgi:D-alanyl-lipoteichoic acid acyltransferase DltB (MBOAT superfamily)